MQHQNQKKTMNHQHLEVRMQPIENNMKPFFFREAIIIDLIIAIFHLTRILLNDYGIFQIITKLQFFRK